MSSTLNILASSLLSTPVLHQKHYPIELTQRFHASTLLSTPLVHQKHNPNKLTPGFHEVQSSTGLHKASLHPSTFSITDSTKCVLEPRFGVIRSVNLFPVTESLKCTLKPQAKPVKRYIGLFNFEWLLFVLL